ncbi:MAG: hypothetical protein J1E37_06585 [Prevotella sp.]|nr:hypothetical protein [Prevotella sp.]
MKHYFIVMAIILGMIAPSASAQNVKKNVAVYMTGKDVQDSYKKVIGAKLVSAITATNEYAAVERTADFLAALSSEHDYQASGEVRDSQIARLGQKFGVRYVVVADVSEVFDELFIASRMINVGSGLVEKSFEANGPAESMAQLIDMASKVAKGLLGGTGGFAQSGGISIEPTNMSLCAVKDGKVVFITPTQWQQMKESEKITFNKKGIFLMENGEAFIVAMRDNGHGDIEAARRYNAPTLLQLRMMYQNLSSLNSALTLFGGTPLAIGNSSNEIFYWSSDRDGANNGYIFNMNTGQYRDGCYSNVPNRLIRPTYALNGLN